MPKITIVANCHCLPIAKILATGSRRREIEFIDVNLLSMSPFKERAEQLQDDRDSLILSFPLSDRWDALSSASLRSSAANYKTFTNIHFSGLHPDITYVGAMGSRVPGAFSDYHSKIILFSFITGRSEEDCRKLFNGSVYNLIGYMDAFSASADELLSRDDECDIKFAGKFIDLSRQEVTMYSLNHPVDVVFSELCASISAQCGIDFEQPGRHMLNNSLSESVVWPIMDEIAEFHRLPYRTSQKFYRTNAFASRGFSLGEVVDSFYSVYRNIPYDEMVAGVSAMPFYQDFLSALG